MVERDVYATYTILTHISYVRVGDYTIVLLLKLLMGSSYFPLISIIKLVEKRKRKGRQCRSALH